MNPEDETQLPETDAQPAPPPEAAIVFTDGADDCLINEVTVRYVARPGQRIKSVALDPAKGIVGLDMDREMSTAVVESVTLTYGRDPHFPGVTFNAGADLLLCMADREWLDQVLAKHRAEWVEEQQREAAERAKAAVTRLRSAYAAAKHESIGKPCPKCGSELRFANDGTGMYECAECEEVIAPIAGPEPKYSEDIVAEVRAEMDAERAEVEECERGGCGDCHACTK